MPSQKEAISCMSLFWIGIPCVCLASLINILEEDKLIKWFNFMFKPLPVVLLLLLPLTKQKGDCNTKYEEQFKMLLKTCFKFFSFQKQLKSVNTFIFPKSIHTIITFIRNHSYHNPHYHHQCGCCQHKQVCQTVIWRGHHMLGNMPF